MSPEHLRIMRSRQIFVTLAAVFCVVGTLFGTGVVGTRVAESSGGELAADATLLAPAGPAFSIWSVIYLGLFAYVLWQWWTPNADTPRHRVTAGLAALSMILNAAWLLVTQQGWILVSVVVIVALLATCALMVARLLRIPADGWGERFVDGTFGLYLGWVCVAVCANVAAAAVGLGAPASGGLATTLAVVVVLVVVGVAAFLTRRLGGNAVVGATVALAIAWGLAWIAVGRLAGRPPSTTVGVLAALAAIAVLGLAYRSLRTAIPSGR